MAASKDIPFTLKNEGERVSKFSPGKKKNGDGVRAPEAYDLSLGKASAADEITVIDDWPEHIPIAAAEIDVLEMFLGDMLDAFLRQRH